MGATEAGIVIEILGAGFLVWRSYQAKLALKNFPAPLTYDNFVKALERTLSIIGAQFIDQLKGFSVLAIGLALQLYGSIG